MPRFVVLSPASNTDVAQGFDVRLGPLAFVCLADALDRSLGEALENVGAVLTAAEPRPRPLKVALPVRGTGDEADPAEAGYRLRRQLTQLLENPRYLASGLYFHWEADPEIDGWLRFGGGDLREDLQSIPFGEWTLELTDCYRLGGPGQLRLGRRLELLDRRLATVARDTRGLIFSTDFNTQALPTKPLIVPGDVANVLLTYGRLPSSSALGPQRGLRRLWRELAAVDGDVASFLPDDAALPDPNRQYLDLEDTGAVRVWDTGGSTVNIADPNSWSTERDSDPTIMGWERVYGPTVAREPQLAIDNGACRLVWLGRAAGQQLAIEYWDAATNHYQRLGRLAGASNVREVTIVELTPERVVVEWRGTERAMRAVLQRGWWGPRIEAYNDDTAGTARLEYVPDAGTPVTAAATPSWVETHTAGGIALSWAKGTNSDSRSTFTGGGTFLNGNGVAYSRTAAIVAQLGTPSGPATAADLAALSLADARPVPVLITR